MEAGNDAEFVGKRGRYRLNWPRALDRYADYKAKKNPHFKRTNQSRRKASNSLRSALLNFYKKEGAWEYMDSRKVNEKDQVVERQFQMPSTVYEALFIDAKLSDIYEEQDEQERKRHLSEGGVGAQASPESSSDNRFDESMDMSCGSPGPLDSTSFDNFLPNPSLDNSADVNTECSGTHFSDCAFQPQMFDEDSVESAMEEICLSDQTSGLMRVVSNSEMGAKMTKVMVKSALNKRDWAVRYLPYRVFNQICTKLNIRRHFFDDFRMVAEQLGMDKDTIEYIGQSENPTHKIFSSCHRGVKVGRLTEILLEIERADVAKVLEDWLAEP
ncbi:uncharacterized protein LOC122963174 isoform X2 [Acropora millepora]|nr:uncharacterized protein LOC122956855 isoform X2 [Acropora millepora]XP_044182454.1 uncharacterized protein LOC122963174 isoform X2 [Acropora millepora]